MKRVGLLRHAEAEPKTFRPDFDRVLSATGRAQADEMAGHLRRDGGSSFDLALVSPSARTRETWDRVGRPNIPVRFERAICDAPVEALVSLLCALDDSISSVIVVGHNPGIEEFAGTLLAVREALPGSFPTAGLAIVSLPVGAWAELPGVAASLDLFASPA